MDRTPTLGGESLVDLLDRLIETGVVAAGDVVLGLADVDLIRLNLRVLLASVESLRPDDDHRPAEQSRMPSRTGPALVSTTGGTPDRGTSGASTGASRVQPAWKAVPAVARPAVPVEGRRDRTELGLGGLVVAVVEIVRQLLERQALRRMEHGSLTADQIERLGHALMQLEEQVHQLADIFTKPAADNVEDTLVSVPLTRR